MTQQTDQLIQQLAQEPVVKETVKRIDRVKRDYELFASLTAELQVHFLHQPPPTSDTPFFKLGCSYFSNMSLQSTGIKEEVFLEYGIVFSSQGIRTELPLREVVFSMADKGFLVSFLEGDGTDPGNDAPAYVLKKKRGKQAHSKINQEFVDSLAEWLMHEKKYPPLHVPGAELQQYAKGLII